MQPNPPLFISRLDPHIAPELHRLRTLDARQFSGTDKAAATRLLTDALHGILDTVFTQLIQDIDRNVESNGPHAKAIRASEATINDVKDKIDHYLGWVVKFLSSKRLVPAIAHYDSLVHQLPDGNLHFAGFAIPAALAKRAEVELREMKDGTRTDASEGIELLIEFLDVSVDPVVRVPMELMNFNFVVTRTLNGVLNLGLGMVKKMLRKLAPVLPQELLPVLARHMETFLVFDTTELADKLARMPEPASIDAGATRART